MIDDDDERDLRSYGRKRGRKMSPRQCALAEVLPRIAIDLTSKPGSDPSCRRHASGMGLTPREIWLEIGFGGGEHLVWQAQQNPHTLLIGCEPYEDGVVKVLARIEGDQIGNIRIHADDARPLLRWLPVAFIGRVFILFPDPWPKKRHAKRRLVALPLLDLLARVMQPGAELRIATDIGDYARTTLLAITRHPAFAWPAASPADWRERATDWPETRYERKAAAAGRVRYYFRFFRI